MATKNTSFLIKEGPSQKRRLPLKRISGILLATIVFLFFFPPTFQFGVYLFLKWEAHQRGVILSIDDIEGAAWSSVTLKELQATSSRNAIIIRIKKAEAFFSLRNFLFGNNSRWFRLLKIDGVDVKSLTPASNNNSQKQRETKKENFDTEGWLPLRPSALEITNADFIFELNQNHVTVKNWHFSASDVEPGTVTADELMVKTPWMIRNFHGINGKTSLEADRISLIDVKFTDDILISSFSLNLDRIAKRELEMDYDIAAFGGIIKGTIGSDFWDERLNMESSGIFSDLSVSRIARSFGLAAPESDGKIREGKFSFRGSPRNLAKATVSLRCEALDFQWNRRQWKSLVVGAMLFDGRIQLREFKLQQEKNQLTLKGEMKLPTARSKWWQSEFALDIAGNIEELGGLTSLFGPQFEPATGKLTIDGSIRGSNNSFNGQLIVAGSKLSFQDIPIDSIQAAIKLNENELQLLNLQLLSNEDFLRGSGSLTIVGSQIYRGELKCSARDLSKYKSILTTLNPSLPTSGNFGFKWSGDGTKSAHSGAFTFTLHNTNLPALSLSNIDADLEATYSPENLYFNKFKFSNNDTRLNARINASPTLLTFLELQMHQSTRLCFESKGSLPFSLWNYWKKRGLAASFTDNIEFELWLSSKKMVLSEIRKLLGLPASWRGEIDSDITVGGVIKQLHAKGKAAFKNAAFPLQDELAQNIDAELFFEGNKVAIKKWETDLNNSSLKLNGDIGIENPYNPTLNLYLTGLVSNEKFSAQITGTWLERTVSISPETGINFEGFLARILGPAIPKTDTESGKNAPATSNP